MSEQRKVTLLGTGLMGAPMARNLLAAGFPLTVWNHSAEKARPLADQGATVVDTPAHAVSQADVIVTMLAAESFDPRLIWDELEVDDE